MENESTRDFRIALARGLGQIADGMSMIRLKLEGNPIHQKLLTEFEQEIFPAVHRFRKKFDVPFE